MEEAGAQHIGRREDVRTEKVIYWYWSFDPNSAVSSILTLGMDLAPLGAAARSNSFDLLVLERQRHKSRVSTNRFHFIPTFCFAVLFAEQACVTTRPVNTVNPVNPTLVPLGHWSSSNNKIMASIRILYPVSPVPSQNKPVGSWILRTQGVSVEKMAVKVGHFGRSAIVYFRKCSFRKINASSLVISQVTLCFQWSTGAGWQFSHSNWGGSRGGASKN